MGYDITMLNVNAMQITLWIVTVYTTLTTLHVVKLS